ncbi:MAG: hypothetical protein KME04_17280 [Pleurocapsa minor GSE-CHR-MK-17-07R]|jgi:hypothetical protein|nr:hypothetical protein [Pleurocapsa minor GSE-CHR-MK 17-07R]
MTDLQEIIAELEATRPDTLVVGWLLDDARVIMDGRERLIFPHALFMGIQRWVESQQDYSLEYSDIDPRGGMEGYFRYVRT